MSGESAQSKAANQQTALQASLQSRLAGVAIPGLESMIGGGGTLTGLLNSTNGGQTLSSLDEAAYRSALGTLSSGYGQAKNTTGEAINYGALRGGESRLSGTGGPVSSALSGAATMLDRDRFVAEQNLSFASKSAGMSNYNKILNLFGQGTQTALGLGAGNANAAMNAMGGMSTQSQAGSVLGGAATGAALGSAVMPGWGTAIGAVGGGIIGAFTAP